MYFYMYCEFCIIHMFITVLVTPIEFHRRAEFTGGVRASLQRLQGRSEENPCPCTTVVEGPRQKVGQQCRQVTALISYYVER